MTSTPTPPPWQPIDENTPRDGTKIEADWSNGAEPEILHWDNDHWTTNDGFKYYLFLPTYWRPILPAEPAPVTGTPREFHKATWDNENWFVPLSEAEAVAAELAAAKAELIKGAEIKEQLYKSLGVVREERQYLQTELATANLHGKTCVHHTDAERAEITCPVCLRNELAAMTTQRDDALTLLNALVSGFQKLKPTT